MILVVAFLGAQGFGADAVGGVGGDVYHVTAFSPTAEADGFTDDGSQGTLRHAVESQDGPRVIVFDGAGYINLTKILLCDRPYLSILGNTATGLGVTVTGRGGSEGDGSHGIRRFDVRGDNAIIRYMRFRLGDDWWDVNQQSTGQGFLLSARSVIVDHCVFSWYADDWQIWNANPTDLVTIQNCIFSESLDKVAEGASGKGVLVAIRGGQISFIGNLIANCRSRWPELGNYSSDIDLVFDFRNNVISACGGGKSQSGLLADPSAPIRMNWVDNLYKASHTNNTLYSGVPHAHATVPWPFITGDPPITGVQIYHSGNKARGFARGGSTITNASFEGTPVFVDTPFETAVVTKLQAKQVLRSCLTHAGMEGRRDSDELRILAQVRAGNGVIVSTPGEWPVFA